MAFLLSALSFYLAYHSAWALPIPAIQQSIPSSCDDIHRCRTLGNIILSCLATIIACTWVAIHPNILGPKSSKFTDTRRHVSTAILTILAPEMLAFWAIRQWYDAGNAVTEERQRKHKWTMVHGFFLVMGGFVIEASDGRTFYISSKAIDELVDNGTIEFPTITEQEIQDRSKGDKLSKGLAILQTGWFLTQCVARQLRHLPVTELEIVTAAFAILNFATYLFWWDKPLNVRCPIILARSVSLSEINQEMGDEGTHATEDTISRVCEWLAGRPEDVVTGHDRILTEKVPPLHSGRLTKAQIWRSGYFEVLASLAFGAIHFFAWSYSPPASVEQVLWRAGSIAMIGATLTIAATCGAFSYAGFYWFPYIRPKWLKIMGGTIIGLSSAVYIIARVALMWSALTSLSSLPLGAYKTDPWINYVPHI